MAGIPPLVGMIGTCVHPGPTRLLEGVFLKTVLFIPTYNCSNQLPWLLENINEPLAQRFYEVIIADHKTKAIA
jgi:hypothetical protein